MRAPTLCARRAPETVACTTANAHDVARHAPVFYRHHPRRVDCTQVHGGPVVWTMRCTGGITVSLSVTRVRGGLLITPLGAVADPVLAVA